MLPLSEACIAFLDVVLFRSVVRLKYDMQAAAASGFEVMTLSQKFVTILDFHLTHLYKMFASSGRSGPGFD